MARMAIASAIGFAVVAFLGLLAARRPQVFARYLLAGWQRERLVGNMAIVARTGYRVFAFGSLTAALIVLETIVRR